MVTRNATITGWTIKKEAMADISIRSLKILPDWYKRISRVLILDASFRIAAISMTIRKRDKTTPAMKTSNSSVFISGIDDVEKVFSYPHPAVNQME
jgi:hypothetical protein